MLLATVFISSISPEPGLLMPGQCRTFRRDHLRTECDRLQLRRPPDPHTSASFEALRASGHRRRDVRDLMELLRDKTLAFNGDSITDQVTSALECSARAHFDTVRPLSTITTAAVPELARRCTQLQEYAAPPQVCETACLGPNRSKAAQYKEGLFPRFGACKDLQWSGKARTGRSPVGRTKERIPLRGFVVGETNTTVVFRLHSTAASAHGCHACVQGPQGTCDRVDACDFDTAPLPSHMSLMPAVGADAVVFNFGLHYGGTTAEGARYVQPSAKTYRAHMVRLLQERQAEPPTVYLTIYLYYLYIYLSVSTDLSDLYLYRFIYRCRRWPASGSGVARRPSFVRRVRSTFRCLAATTTRLSNNKNRLTRRRVTRRRWWWCGTARAAMGSRTPAACARLAARLRLPCHGATRLCTTCSGGRG